MPCTYVKIPGGGVVLVKHAAPRAKRCSCGASSTLLCDWKMADAVGTNGPKATSRSTCDRPICKACAMHVGEDKDLCPEHAAAWRAHPRFRP